MKLSEAILLGSVGSGQARAMLRDQLGNTCAMGAALLAANLMSASHVSDGEETGESKLYRAAEKKWPVLKEMICQVQCPSFKIPAKSWPLLLVITRLNDIDKWTRPQIAAWVATIEEEYEKQQAVTQPSTQQEVCHETI